LCAKLGVSMLQVSKTPHEPLLTHQWGLTTSPKQTPRSELGSQQSPEVKIAWCFSKRVNEWEHTWKLVKLGVSAVSYREPETYQSRFLTLALERARDKQRIIRDKLPPLTKVLCELGR